MYGAKYKQAKVLKMIPFSHAPHNTAQKQAVRAFEKLNRYSAGIAKAFFPWLGLSTRGLLKHNAVAKWLAPCVAERKFSLSATSQVIPADETCKITAFEVDRVAGTIKIAAETTIPPNATPASAWVVLLLDSNGKVVYSVRPEGMAFSAIVPLELDPRFSYSAVVFRSDRENRKAKVHGFDMAGGSFVVGGRVLIDLFANKANFSVENGRLVINDPSISVQNGRVVLVV